MTAKRKPRPKGQGHTPRISIRVPDDLKAKVQKKAKAKGETMTDVTIRAYERYVSR